ncbi:DNA-directed RNA polymerase subunit P [archaeon]|nr:DNA-directed RNA polymerase subunit P [archaeon]
MAQYVCISCGKDVKQEYVKKKVRCPYCGSKILYKSRTVETEVDAV